jgi:sensor c-di-GMP phosphodiesterase-like protein
MVHPCVRMALVEALRRALGWRHRQLGMIQPDRFIGLA